MLSPFIGPVKTLKLLQERSLPEQDAHCKIFPDVIIASYFTSRPDPQTGNQIAPDQEDYIAPWYTSMRHHNAHGLVFHDGLSPDFIARFQTERIRFISCSPGPRSLNDEPYLIYLLFLLCNPYQRIFFTDICDVIINKLPFSLFTNPWGYYTLFVGRDRFNLNGHSLYIAKQVNHYKRLSGIGIDPFLANCPMYNSGIIGGSYPVVLFVLLSMASAFLEMETGRSNNMNMMILNKVIHDHFYETPDTPIFCQPFVDTEQSSQPLWSSGVNGLPYWVVPAGLSPEDIWQPPLSADKKPSLLIQAETIDQAEIPDNSGINLSPGVIPHLDRISQTPYICSGYPLCSPFYTFSETSHACFIHK